MNKPKIFFIIDDDVDDQEIFVAAVNEVDPTIKCIVAADCEEALSFLRNRTAELPGYIFLDLNMPRINGRQCLVELRKESHLKHIPIIIYSTSSLKKDIDDTAQLGADHFLVKPNKFDELCDALAGLLQNNWSLKGLENN